MSLALTHFAIGAGGMLLVLAAVRPRTRYRSSIIVASGVWALVPDLHYVIPGTNDPLQGLKFSVLGDLFWFHQTLDGVHVGRGTRSGAVFAVLFLAAAAVTADLVAERSRHD